MPFTTDETLLVFRIAGIPFAVPAKSVGSILMPPEHITHAPGSHRSTPGIFHHAEATWAVIDLHKRFGSEEPLQGSGRMLLYEEENHHFAFLVDEVVGLKRSEEGKWANLPPYLPRDIFPIGFLLKEEIILCSELPLLRNMHDVGPLRHHAEQIKQQASRDSVKESTTKPVHDAVHTMSDNATERPSTKTESRHKTSATVENANTPPTEGIKTAGVSTYSTPAAIPRSTEPARTEKQKSAAITLSTTLTAKPADFTTKPPAGKPTEKTPPAGKPPRKIHTPATTGIPEASHLSQPAVPAHRLSRREKPTVPVALPPNTTPVSSPINATDSSGNDNSWLWLTLFLLLLVALPLGYLLWPEPKSQYSTPPRVTTSSPSIIVGEKPAAISTEPSRSLEQSEAAAMEAATDERPPLRIVRDEEGVINLIIDRQAAAQNSTSVLPQSEAQTSMKTTDSTTTEIAPLPEEQPTAKEPIGENEPSPAAEKTIEKKVLRHIHIVVKGDTLWDIAERYTGNAFNYPELARRSGIKNPDRIYPGDRVRIIIR